MTPLVLGALLGLTADELATLGASPSATSVVVAGHRLELATPQTYTERVARVDAADSTGTAA